jgi:hypothetical protein
VGGQDAGQRDAAVVEDVGVQDDLVRAGVLDPRDVLDGEFDAGQFALPAALDVLHRVEDEIVELLGPAARQGHLGRDEASAQAAAVSVAAGPGTGSAAWVGHIGCERTADDVRRTGVGTPGVIVGAAVGRHGGAVA